MEPAAFSGVNLSLQLDDEAYAIAEAHAEAQHCSISAAVSKLVVQSGFAARKDSRANSDAPEIRFPLVRGKSTITAEHVFGLEEET